MDILAEIVKHKRTEVEMLKRVSPLSPKTIIRNGRMPVSMRERLAAASTGIIAEFKRRSPSKGWINRDARPEQVLPLYEGAGASACSVLADREFFGGSPDDMARARNAANLPLLFKEFVIDEYQIMQAFSAGADAVLLIASVLPPGEIAALARRIHDFGMEVLLEVHTADELCALNGDMDMLGINNRNLGSFFTDTGNSLRMAEAVRKATKGFASAPLLVSESGITSGRVIAELKRAGYGGFLVGESLMRGENPGDNLRRLIEEAER